MYDLFRTVHPYTAELIAEYPSISEHDLDQALDRVSSTFVANRSKPVSERAAQMHALADLLDSRQTALAALMTLEMGKPIAQAEAEITKCSAVCRYYAEVGPQYLQPKEVKVDKGRAYVSYRPLGTVVAIMPWNFPFWQVFRFLAPALLVGNSVIIKHAPNTPQCALAIEALLRDVGLGEQCQVVFATHHQIEKVITDKRIRGVTLTGSTRAGSEVAQTAGKYLKPTVFELGGSDPFIVLNDCDLDRAVQTAILSRSLNNGQSCIAAKRFLVQSEIYPSFVGKFSQQFIQQPLGDPSKRETAIGPLARADLRDRLSLQVDAAISRGFKKIANAPVPEGPGFFFAPTALEASVEDLLSWDEELFGPVAVIAPFQKEQEAIAVANATPYGLGASIWSNDQKRAENIAAQLESGMVFINGLVRSDQRLPFGGVKCSGFGRELGQEGVYEFVNTQTVWVE